MTRAPVAVRGRWLVAEGAIALASTTPRWDVHLSGVLDVVGQRTSRVRPPQVVLSPLPAGPTTLLVVAPGPVAARLGIEHVVTGDAVAAVADSELVSALRSVVPAAMADCRVVSPQVVADARPLADLDVRALKVALGVASGLSNEEIAGQLHVSAATVKRDIAALARALNLRNRTELAAFTSRHRSHHEPGGSSVVGGGRCP